VKDTSHAGFPSVWGLALSMVLLFGAGLAGPACGVDPLLPTAPPPLPPPPMPRPEPEPEPPSTPTSLRISAIGDDFIEWSWNAVAGAAYEVQFSLDESFDDGDEIIGRTSEQTSYRRQSLPGGTRAYLRVRSHVAIAEERLQSPWSRHITGMTTKTNGAPATAGAIPDQSLHEDTDATTLDIARYFEDPDGDALTYRASSDRTGVVRVTVSGSEITLDPRNDGTATITVTASDPAGLGATQTFRVTVAPSANRAPTAVGEIPGQSLREDSAGTLDVERYFEDPDGDALTYRASSSRASVVRVTVSGSELMLDPRNDGTATITVTASDPAGLSAAQTFQVSVTPEAPSGSTVLYEVGDRVPFPSGIPPVNSGVSVSFFDGVYKASRGAYVEWPDEYRFTCVATRCEVRTGDNVVTVGTIARTPAGQEPG